MLAKIFIRCIHFDLVHKTEFERCFPTPGSDTFVMNSISYKKLHSEIFHKFEMISTFSSKTEFERFFPSPGGVTLVQNSIFYQKFPSENFHECNSFRHIHIKLNPIVCFRPQWGHIGSTFNFLQKISCPNFLQKCINFDLFTKNWIRMFFFLPLVATLLFKI